MERTARSVGKGMVLGVAIVVIAAVAMRLVPGGFSLSNPIRTTTKERDHSAVLIDLRDVSRYEAAVGQYQVVVDIEKDVKYLPSWLAGEHVTFMAEGEVSAMVDFTGLPRDAVEVSADGERATVTLPSPTLTDPRIDPDQTRVLSDDKGLATKIGSVFASGDHDQELYQRAEKKLATSAKRSGLEKRAERNTRQMLTGLLGELGIDDVTVVFAKPRQA